MKRRREIEGEVEVNGAFVQAIFRYDYDEGTDSPGSVPEVYPKSVVLLNEKGEAEIEVTPWEVTLFDYLWEIDTSYIIDAERENG